MQSRNGCDRVCAGGGFVRIWAGLANLCFSLCFAAAATAQIGPRPPVVDIVDSNQVSLLSHDMDPDPVYFAVGDPAYGGMEYTGPRGMYRGWIQGSNAGMDNDPISGLEHYITIGKNTEGFETGGAYCPGYCIYYPKTESGSKLEVMSGDLVCTTKDGTEWVFDGYINLAGQWSSPIMQMRKPTGEILTWNYRTHYVPFTTYGYTHMLPYHRLQSVTSNLGYMMHFQYADNVETSDYYYALVKVVSIDTSAVSCGALDFQCLAPAGWPSVTYGGTASTSTFTDNAGRTTTFTWAAHPQPSCGYDLSGIRSPASALNDVSITYHSTFCSIASVTNASGAWSYAYAHPPSIYDPLNTITVSGPNQFRRVIDTGRDDFLGLSYIVSDTLYNYAGGPVASDSDYIYAGIGLVGQVTRVTPVGTQVTQADYNDRGNATQTRQYPVGGGAAIVVSATYPANCSSLTVAQCDKPTSVTDERGKVTDYTYHTSGGVLIETGPAPGSGPYSTVRPEKRFTYADGGVGIWRVETEKSCRTTSSCANTADELVVQTTYDAKRRPIRIVTRSGDLSVVIGNPCPTPEDVRCSEVNMTYTPVGDVASVDGPAYGSADTSYTTYDAARQKIFEIGPDPDGLGGQPRVIVKHTYDLDGNETLTQTGVGIASDGSNFVPKQYKAMTYDSYGRLIRTETGKY
jgi:hypothetical protein